MARVAKALIENKDGKYLLLTRSDTHPHLAGHLDLPGGIVESGEDFVVGVQRELKEETGLDVPAEALELQHSFTDKWPGERRLYYAKLAHDPVVTISWEHSEYRWSPLEELIASDNPAADSYMRAVVKHLTTQIKH